MTVSDLTDGISASVDSRRPVRVLVAAMALMLCACESLGIGADEPAPEAVLLGVPVGAPPAAKDAAADDAGAATETADAEAPTEASPDDGDASPVRLPSARDLMGQPLMTAPLGMTVIHPAEPLTAAYPTDLPALATRAADLAADAAADEKATRRNVTGLPLFSAAPPGLDFRRNGLHRAMTIAEPALCSYTRADSGYVTAQEAVTDSMLRCLSYVGDLADALQLPCECKLAALDEVLFVSPEEIDWRPAMPALTLFQSTSQPENTSGFYGLLEMNTGFAFGEAVRIYAKDGTIACEGQRSAATDREGSLDLTCFDTDESVQGQYRVFGRYLGEPYGLAQAVSDQRRFLVLFGLDGQSFDRRLRQFRTGGSVGPGAVPPAPVTEEPLAPAVEGPAQGAAPSSDGGSGDASGPSGNRGTAVPVPAPAPLGQDGPLPIPPPPPAAPR